MKAVFGNFYGSLSFTLKIPSVMKKLMCEGLRVLTRHGGQVELALLAKDQISSQLGSTRLESMSFQAARFGLCLEIF